MPSRKFACREAIRLPDEQREELCKAKSQEAERDKSGHRRKAFLLSVAHKRRFKSSAAYAASKICSGRNGKPTVRRRTKMSFLSRRGEAALHNRLTHYNFAAASV